MSNPNVHGIGEILWDELPQGRELGGAPANFAYHAAQLGAESNIISRVGTDQLGRDLLDRLERLHLKTALVQRDPATVTSTVSVSIDPNGQAQYTIHEPVAWDSLAATPAALAAVSTADAVCFGTLAQRSAGARAAIQRLVRATPSQALRILDINLRQHFFSEEIILQSLQVSNVLKVNEVELPLLARMLDLPPDSRQAIEQLTRDFHLGAVAFTRGGNGSILYVDGRWSEHPGVPVTVADTVGAGDAFTAALAIGLLKGWEPGLINTRANAVAAFVAGQHGATPQLPEEFKIWFRTE